MKLATKKSAQEIQDDIFRKMPAEKKIKLALDLTALCLTLHSLHAAARTGKNSRENIGGA
ncbi:hypothetical protein HYW83_04290 [Candidatus Peregrinibacteria bacterium]|nr:hypothetical protein [Candidatus Peregrinibacteria bacterium]